MFAWFMRMLARFHKWEYRNPHDRQCKHCGLIQIRFAQRLSDTGWWEDMNYGKAAPCNPRATQAAKQGEQANG